MIGLSCIVDRVFQTRNPLSISWQYALKVLK